MKFVRLSVGGGAMLLSLLGLLVCIAGVCGVWMLKGRVEAVSQAVFGAADKSLVFVDAAVDRVEQALDASRRRVSGMSKAVERLRNPAADAKEESEPLLQVLEEVYQQVKAAESWLESSRALVQGVSSVSEAVVSSDYAASHEDSAGIAIAQRVQELSERVAEVLATLQVVREEIIELRDKGQLAREIAARVAARVVDLDGKLARVSSRLEEFHAKVAHTKASLGDLEQRVHWWVLVAAAAITMLFVWFGISQIGMVGHGWRVMRRQAPA